jgi:hypothetical protein
MPQTETEKLVLLESYFSDMAAAIGEYINCNKDNLPEKEVNQLFDQKISLLNLAGEMNMLSAASAFEDAEQSLKDLENITVSVKTVVKKALAVQDAINIAASLVALGTGILSCDPKVIGTRVIEAGQALKLT